MDLLERNIAELITEQIEALGYEIVRVKFYDSSRSTLQIMAERKSDKDLNIDDCALISRTISDILDVEDPIASEYNLEVSSPGIDRPLVRLKDFTDYVDYEAKITTALPIDGRKRYKGRLKGVSEENEIIIKLDDMPDASLIAFDNIASAKLVMSDELIKKSQTIG